MVMVFERESYERNQMSQLWGMIKAESEFLDKQLHDRIYELALAERLRMCQYPPAQIMLTESALIQKKWFKK